MIKFITNIECLCEQMDDFPQAHDIPARIKRLPCKVKLRDPDCAGVLAILSERPNPSNKF